MRTTDRCHSLYMKPGMVGAYLQPFKQDPAHYGLFEWADGWVHPLSNRPVFAVPFVEVALEEEPDTDGGEGGDDGDEDKAVAQMQRKMAATGLAEDDNGQHNDDDDDDDDSDDSDRKARKARKAQAKAAAAPPPPGNDRA